MAGSGISALSSPNSPRKHISEITMPDAREYVVRPPASFQPGFPM